MPDKFVFELLLVLAAGLAAGMLCLRYNLPTVLGYLAAGGVLGPGLLGLVSHDTHEIELLAEAGVFLLLFSIGLEFSLEDLLRMAGRILLGGTVQMTAVGLPVTLALHAYGTSLPTAFLLGSAVAFSSTVLVFKALAEAGASSTRPGRSALGILLYQDAALVPLLMLLPMITAGEAPDPWHVVLMLGKALLFVTAVIVGRRLLAQLVLPRLATYRSPEMVVLFTLVVLGTVTLVAHVLQLPPAVGAFAAGLIFSGNRWTHQFSALVLPFRETFAAVFFISLGLLLNLQLFLSEPVLVIGGIAAIVVLKWLAAVLALWATGVGFRLALNVGLTLAHVGEFAFVLLLVALETELISDTTHERFMTIALGTLGVMPLLLRPALRAMADVEDETPHEPLPGVAIDRALVVGLGPVGGAVASQLETLGWETSLVDRSPTNLYPFAQLGFHTVTGDATQSTILADAGVDDCRLAIVCVPDDNVALAVLQQIRAANPHCLIIVRCRYQVNLTKLLRAGAQRVISEESQAVEQLGKIIGDLVPDHALLGE